METIIEVFEKQIPNGSWCNNGGIKNWCPYFEVKKPTFSKNGSIQSYYCNLMKKYVCRQIFKFKDLVGRTINVRSFRDKDIDIIVGHDVDTGELFVFREINHPTEADV